MRPIVGTPTHVVASVAAPIAAPIRVPIGPPIEPRPARWGRLVLVPVLALSAYVGCATTDEANGPARESTLPSRPPTSAESLAEDPAVREPPLPGDPVVPAGGVADAARCEGHARARLQQGDREGGWGTLVACVDRARFADLRRLLDGTWDQELLHRADAPTLLARVIARRGGDVESDAALLRDHRIPIFTLAQAVGDPQQFAGHLLVVRVQVVGREPGGDPSLVRLIERTLGNELRDQRLSPVVRHTERRTWSGVGDGGPAQAGVAPYGGTEVRTFEVSRPSLRAVNVGFSTGLQALARLDRPDPFLAPGDELIALVRFNGFSAVSTTIPAGDGIRTAAPVSLPIVSPIAFYPPAATITY